MGGSLEARQDPVMKEQWAKLMGFSEVNLGEA